MCRWRRKEPSGEMGVHLHGRVLDMAGTQGDSDVKEAREGRVSGALREKRSVSGHKLSWCPVA